MNNWHATAHIPPTCMLWPAVRAPLPGPWDVPLAPRRSPFLVNWELSTSAGVRIRRCRLPCLVLVPWTQEQRFLHQCPNSQRKSLVQAVVSSSGPSIRFLVPDTQSTKVSNLRERQVHPGIVTARQEGCLAPSGSCKPDLTFLHLDFFHVPNI